MVIKRITEPALEPVTLTEVKAHLRDTSNNEDDFLTSLIRAARIFGERYHGRAYIEQTWRMSLDGFRSPIRLPYPPLISVVSIQYLDAANALQTLDSSVYEVFTDDEPGEIRLAADQNWPTTYAAHNAVKVTFKAGYGTAASSVPETVKVALKQLVAHWANEGRQPVMSGISVSDVPKTVEYLFDVDRVPNV
jgi:uncharacterized phiE125 gp8 family phage protein